MFRKKFRRRLNFQFPISNFQLLISTPLNIITEYPPWFIIFCLLIGIIFSGILYFKNKRHEFPKRLVVFLGILRFFSISLIAFLLLSPLLKSVIKHFEKPIIIIAQDNSESIVIGKDSSYYKTKYFDELNGFVDNLSADYDVKKYFFSDEVEFIETDNFPKDTEMFSGNQTDFDVLFDEIDIRYSNRNVGAVILAGDGLYNKGKNPLYVARQIGFPVYSIALGDTNIQKDIILEHINYNRIAYLNNEFPIEILVKANKCKNLTAKLEVFKGKNVLFSQSIDFTSDKFLETIRLNIEAIKTGLQKYSIKLSPLENEISYANNERNIFIDILDSKQRILILANSPHPDIAALKSALESNINYEVEDFLIDNFSEQISKYSLVVLHQLPSKENPELSLINRIKNSKIPILFIIGNQTEINLFNELEPGISILNHKNISVEAQASLNDKFSLFELSEATSNLIPLLPPLVVPFGTYNKGLSAASNILFYQKINRLLSPNPLITFTENLDLKTGIVLGEGLWRWKMYDYSHNSNHNSFNEIFNKTIQYLSVKEDKSNFRVLCKNSFNENENVEFEAQVYNQSYEMINEPEIEINIIDKDENVFPFTFTPTKNAYSLNAGSFPVGTYNYEAKVKVGEKQYFENGEFIVKALDIETINSIADHALMYKLANRNDGEMVYPEQFDRLYNLINEREDIKTIIYSQFKFVEIINLFWIFIVILSLLTTEWFLRKWSGGY